MYYNILKNHSSIKSQISHIKQAILANKVVRPQNISQFVFLCGANNKKNNSVSERRKALLEFSKRNLPHTTFFIAEDIFFVLQAQGNKKNFLDIEEEISNFADTIIIVLESPSAFAELGAFSHKELRRKLIVINDKAFEHAPSFIKLGPIKAVEEVSGSENIIYYPMSENGVSEIDRIPDIFTRLERLLNSPPTHRVEPVSIDSCNPAEKFDRYSTMFLHDLIYFMGPLSHKELIEILKQIFDDSRFKLNEHIAMLFAFKLIAINKNLYKSLVGKTFYQYKFDVHKVIASFRNIIQKRYPERIYDYES
ncbi:MAG: retron St85 family effector protein [Candidatus Auribacterota bacterium]